MIKTPEIPEIPGSKIKVAIIREEGSNSDREMAAAFVHAGAQPVDITTTELVNGNVDLNNLLDEEGTKPSTDPAPPQAGEPLQPPDFTNKTDTDMPVATQKEDKLGTVPQTERTEILPNRIMDAGTNDQPFDYQEGMAARQVDTGDAENPTMGYQYKQGTTVAGGLPRAKYRNR